MAQVGLTLHPDKTRIVYCKDGRRRGSGEHTSFTFLGYTFRARGVRTKTGRMMTGFTPAISKDAWTSSVRKCGHGGCTGGRACPKRTSPGGLTPSCEAG